MSFLLSLFAAFLLRHHNQTFLLLFIYIVHCLHYCTGVCCLRSVSSTNFFYILRPPLPRYWFPIIDSWRRQSYQSHRFHAMRRRAAEMEVSRATDLCWLFNSLVRPSLEYGCEVWGPQYIASRYRSPLSSNDGLRPGRQLQARLLRTLLHLQVHDTSIVSLDAELGIWPLEIRYMQSLSNSATSVCPLSLAK